MCETFLVHLHRMWLLHHSFANVKTRISIPCSVPEIWYHCLECHRKHETAVDKDCKNLNSCCKLELENIFISCFNNSSLHYWVTFEKNIFFSHPLVLSERKFLLSHENSTKSTAVSCFLWHSRQWYQISGTLHGY